MTRTISRIAARCVRSGNIALEEYPFYGYILDVLEEISETGDYIVAHQELYPYVEKKIAGGIGALKKNLNEFKTELKNNASPEMIKQDKDELDRMKEALGAVDKSTDPTVGAGMSMDEVVDKLLHKQENPDNRPRNQQQNRPQNQGQANVCNSSRDSLTSSARKDKGNNQTGPRCNKGNISNKDLPPLTAQPGPRLFVTF